MSQSKKSDNYTTFGKFLIGHFELPINPDDIDWRYVTSEYKKTLTSTKLGLVYINWIVSKQFGQNPLIVRTTSRRLKSTADPRRVGQYIAHTIFDYGYSELKRFYHRKQHQTIMSNIESVANDIKTDKKLDRTVTSIINKLTNLEYGSKQIARNSSKRSS